MKVCQVPELLYQSHKCSIISFSPTSKKANPLYFKYMQRQLLICLVTSIYATLMKKKRVAQTVVCQSKHK